MHVRYIKYHIIYFHYQEASLTQFIHIYLKIYIYNPFNIYRLKILPLSNKTISEGFRQIRSKKHRRTFIARGPFIWTGEPTDRKVIFCQINSPISLRFASVDGIYLYCILVFSGGLFVLSFRSISVCRRTISRSLYKSVVSHLVRHMCVKDYFMINWLLRYYSVKV